jgi:hypothetical protein
MQLTAMGVAAEKRAKFGEYAWPQTCAAHAHAFNEALRDAGKGTEGKDPIAPMAENVAKLLKEPKSITDDLSEAIDKLFAAVGAQKISAMVSVKDQSCPTASSGANVDTFRDISGLSKATIPLSSIYPSPFPSPVLQFVVDHKGEGPFPALCTTSSKDKHISCRKLADSLAGFSPGLRLWGTSEDAIPAYLFAGDRGAAGLLKVETGERVDGTTTYGASFANGWLSLLSWDEGAKTVRLRRTKAGASTVEQMLFKDEEIGNPYYSVGLFWDNIVYKAIDKKTNTLKLYTRSLPNNGGPTGAPLEMGDLAEHGRIEGPEDEPHVAACKTDSSTMIVRVKGWNRQHLSFLAGGKWTAPLVVDGQNGLFNCNEAEAVFTYVYRTFDGNLFAPRIDQQRCSSAGCQQGSVSFVDLVSGIRELYPQKANNVYASDVKNNLLIVWQAGEVGGVRMRFAPVDRISTVPDTIIYDDFVQNGGVKRLSTVLEMRLLAGQGYALVVLSTTNGVHFLRVDESGKVEPSKVVWGN